MGAQVSSRVCAVNFVTLWYTNVSGEHLCPPAPELSAELGSAISMDLGREGGVLVREEQAEEGCELTGPTAAYEAGG